MLKGTQISTVSRISTTGQWEIANTSIISLEMKKVRKRRMKYMKTKASEAAQVLGSLFSSPMASPPQTLLHRHHFLRPHPRRIRFLIPCRPTHPPPLPCPWHQACSWPEAGKRNHWGLFRGNFVKLSISGLPFSTADKLGMWDWQGFGGRELRLKGEEISIYMCCVHCVHLLTSYHGFESQAEANWEDEGSRRGAQSLSLSKDHLPLSLVCIE